MKSGSGKTWPKLAFVIMLAIFQANITFGFAGGDGSADDPYQISSRKHLESINDALDAHYILTDDIDLAGVTYSDAVIAVTQSSSFIGSFNGNGFVIKNVCTMGGMLQ